MTKKVTIKAKPTTKSPARSADEWVSAGAASPAAPAASEPAQPEREPTTRYTIDIPTALHAKIKIKCALKGVKMNEEITRLLKKHFGD
jgi:hypothetical protein